MKNKKGFTLVELLVVMVIFIIIVGLSYPAIKVLQSKSLDKKFNTYKDSMSLGAKLYKDSYDEDMFGRKENGCTCVKFEELKNKTLIKDISLNDVTCNTENTFVRVTKVDDNYTYTSFLGCKNKGSSDIDYIYPKAQEVHTFDSEGCNTLCNPEKSNGLYVYADPGEDTHYTKTKTIRLHVQSITGINQGIDISYSWSTSNTGSEELTNYKKLRLSAPDDQKKKIAAGQIIEVDPPKIKTPAKSSGSYYLHVRVDNLTDLYGASWSQGDGGKYLVFGPYNIDNDPPLITKTSIIPSDTNYYLPKPNLTVNAVDNITETDNLRSCISITKDSKFHHQLYSGTDNNILINSNNGCLEKYVNNSTYISNYYKKFIGEVNLSLMDSYGEEYPLYLSVIDEAGNHAYKELNYQTANKYTIEYDSNGGSECNPAKKEVITKISGDTTWGTLCTPTKSGDTFGGWFSETTQITKDTKATRDLKVKAKWNSNKEITYVFQTPNMTYWNYIFGYKYLHTTTELDGYTTFNSPTIYDQSISHQVDSLGKSKTDNITFKNVSYNSTPRNGITFSGANQRYMELGSLDSLKHASLEATFKLSDTTGGNIIGNGQGGGIAIGVGEENKNIIFSIGVRPGVWDESEKKWTIDPYQKLRYNVQLEKNKKYHVVGTFDGENMILYLNGEKVAERNLIDDKIKLENDVIMTSKINIHPPTEGATGKIFAEPTENGAAKAPFIKGSLYSARIYKSAIGESKVISNFRRENIKYNIIGNPTNEKFYVKLTTGVGKNYTLYYKYKNGNAVKLKDGGKGIKVTVTNTEPTSGDIASGDIIKSQRFLNKKLTSITDDSMSFTATSTTTYLIFDFSDTDPDALDLNTSLGQFSISTSHGAGKKLGTPLLIHRRSGMMIGWNTKADGKGDFVDNSKIINDNLTLYARWTNKYKCTVRYDPNGGVFTSNANSTTQTFTDGISGVSSLRDANGGHYSAVWAHHLPYPGKEWKKGTKFYDQTQGYSVIDFCPNIATKDETVTLQVNWATNYVLTLDHQGATKVNSLNTYYTLDNTLHSESTCTSLVSKITIPEKRIFSDLYDVLYKFKGYYTEPNGKGMQIINENGNVNSTNVAKISSDCKIYAYWAKVGWEFVNKSTLIDYRNHLSEQLWMYWNGDGTYATGWLKICVANYDCGNNTGWYYFYPGTGYMALGWFKVGSYWYYADPTDSGGSGRNGYVDGTMLRNTIRWFKYAGTNTTYCAHFADSGECFSGTRSYNGTSYTCKADGCPNR